METVFKTENHGISTLLINGELSLSAVSNGWNSLFSELSKQSPQNLHIILSSIKYCDDAGYALLKAIYDFQKNKNRSCSFVGLATNYEQQLNSIIENNNELIKNKGIRYNLIEKIGKMFSSFCSDVYVQIIFAGELSVNLMKAFFKPSILRWQDIFSGIYQGGVKAVPIVIILNFLMGLIMAFQSAIPMRQFGADVYVANLVGLSVLRELGPLMCAVILAGRSSSAFAAELGTMKINEELDALSTMGLKPIKFIVINRVIAVLIFTPILTLFADFFGLVGGAVVFKSLGYPVITYINQLLMSVSFMDFFGGFIKSFVFGLFIATIGCLRGLETKIGSGAVGIATTRAVVSGLVLIVLIDGIFAVIYYFIGI